MRERMRRLERRDDAFELAAQLEGFERLGVGRRHIVDALHVVEPGMFGADARIVEAGRDRMRFGDLPVLVHQKIGAVAMQHAGPAAGDRGRMLAGCQAVARRLDAIDLDVLVVEEGMEQAHRIGAAADRRNEGIGQAAFALEHLLLRLIADDALEVAHHLRIGMWARHRADAIEGVLDIGDPVAQGFVERILQRARARKRRHDFGAQELHAEHIGLLPLDIDLAHIDDAFEAEARAGGRGRDAMLAGARLGDDARLAHAAREQDLAHHIVDLVRAGVIELVALEVDLGAAQMLGQPLGEIERARAPDIVFEETVELGLERGVGFRVLVGLLEIEDERHQGFGDEAAAIDAEQPLFIGTGAIGVGLDLVHGRLSSEAPWLPQ